MKKKDSIISKLSNDFKQLKLLNDQENQKLKC